MTDSPYAKPNKATKSSQSPLPPEGTQTRIHITETQTTHHYQQQHGEPYPPQPATQTKQNQLDSMLGNLQADMSRQGVNTTQKGCCSACEKPIVGQVNSTDKFESSRSSSFFFKEFFLKWQSDFSRYRWSPLWGKRGILNISHARTATRNWAREISSRGRVILTASRITTIFSHHVAPTATAPF